VKRLISIIGTGAIIACAFAPVRAANLTAGKQDYQTFCASCHGSGGHGRGSAGAALAIQPAHLSDCTMMAKMSDDTIFNVIKKGGGATGRSKEMPAWGSAFKDGEIHDLVAFLRTFCEK